MSAPLGSGGDETSVFIVVVNDEGQYSIWLAAIPIPRGWKNAGMRGSREECLEYIESVWTDMTPMSVRDSLRPHD